jgi:uncharacterized protein (TIGR04255 family)
MKKLPLKIDHDSLKDAVIQVVFSSKYHSSLILGKIHNLISDSFTFEANPDEILEGENHKVHITPQHLTFKSESNSISINIVDNSIVFNTLNKYSGWDIYFPTINDVLTKCLDSGLINGIYRVGIRYVNEYSFKIFEKIKPSINLLHLNQSLSHTQLRSEFEHGEFKIVINLINAINKNNQNQETSFIDIDVIKTFEPILKDKETLIDIIDKAHAKEKEIFFSLLNEDYLASLNPIYS